MQFEQTHSSSFISIPLVKTNYFRQQNFDKLNFHIQYYVLTYKPKEEPKQDQ